MIKILIGGSPCTHWSIAQKNNRETEPNSGLGWELFKNFLIAKEKYKPDYFLYENNKSASQGIKDEIAKQLGVGTDENVRFTYINSALVSAQNRQRFYVTNFGDIKQPEDRGILLKDVLESGETWKEKSLCIDACYYKGGNLTNLKKQSGQRLMAAEPVCMRYERSDKAKAIRKQYEAGEIKHGFRELSELHPRPDGKTNTLSTVGKDNLICEPVGIGYRGRMNDGKWVKQYESNGTQKANALTTAQTDSMVAEPVGATSDGKAFCLTSSYQFGVPVHDTLSKNRRTMVAESCNPPYAIPCEWDEDSKPTKAISGADGKVHTVYEVKDGQITIKGKTYPIKLSDGFYIIRKLTVKECMRLQTIPEWYKFPASDSQAYKMIGNGWTVEVIKHLLSHIPNIENEEIEVLSMYDGMSCGQIALKEMGCNIVKYYATEIDKYAIQTTQENFPNTIHLGDAFQVRDEGWGV